MLRINRQLTFGPNCIWRSKGGIWSQPNGGGFSSVIIPLGLPSPVMLVWLCLSSQGPVAAGHCLPDRVLFCSLALREVGGSLLLGQAQSHCTPLCGFLKPCLSFTKLF